MPRKARKTASGEGLKPWQGILLAMRTCKAPFGAAELAAAAGLSPGPRSTAEAIASAWLGKMVRWGYAVRVAREAGRRGRARTLYEVTRWGRKYAPGGLE